MGNYFHRYSEVEDWRMARGWVEGREAVLVYDPRRPEAEPEYFVLLQWEGGRIVDIRDYRYARYVTRDADLLRSQ